jgi:hypothetical protein
VIPIKAGKLDRTRTIDFAKRTKLAMIRLGIAYKWRGVVSDHAGYAGDGRKLTDGLFQERGTNQ